MALFQAVAEALFVQARYSNSPRSVSCQTDVQLRSAPPTRADDSAANAAAQRDRGLAEDAEDGLEALPPACVLISE